MRLEGSQPHEQDGEPEDRRHEEAVDPHLRETEGRGRTAESDLPSCAGPVPRHSEGFGALCACIPFCKYRPFSKSVSGGAQMKTAKGFFTCGLHADLFVVGENGSR
jgi:hypothetical protein